MKRRSILFSFVVAVILITISPLNISAQDVDLDPYAGEWVSISCEWRPSGDNDNPVYLTRQWIFDEELNLSARFTFYGDRECNFPLFTVGFDGFTELAGFNSVADGALNTNFRLTNLYLEAKNEDILVSIANADPSCGSEEWRLGVEQEISDTGCLAFGFQAIDPDNLAGENDMIYVRDEHLYFGARLLDGSSSLNDEQRPTALQVPLVRAETMTNEGMEEDAMAEASVVEIVRFQQVGDISIEEMIRLAGQAGDVLYQQDGFIKRYFSQSSEGEWLIVNFWRDLDAVTTDNAAATADPLALEMFPYINQETIVLVPYSITTFPVNEAQLETANIIELLSFSSVEDAEASAVTEAANAAGDVLYQQDGFVGRYFSGTEDGQWLILNFWTSAEANEVGNAVASQAPEVAPIFAVIDNDTVYVDSFVIQTRPE